MITQNQCVYRKSKRYAIEENRGRLVRPSCLERATLPMCAKGKDKTIRSTMWGTGYSSYNQRSPARQSFHITTQRNHRNTFGKRHPHRR